MSFSSPMISVLMSVYNGEKFLAESIESILQQSFKNFEFIIIDDASTDNTAQILSYYAARDPRIHILKNTVNLKLAISLNNGMQAAKAPIIARMDADDWCYPHRLEVQLNFLQQHPEVTLCGSFIEEYESGIIRRCATTNLAIRTKLIFDSSIYHPTVMFKRNIILQKTQGYSNDRLPAEDYDLWVRLSEHHDVIFANIPEVLLRYRVHPQYDRTEYRQKMHTQADHIRTRMLNNLSLLTNYNESQYHNLLLSAKKQISILEFLGCSRWVKKIYNVGNNEKYAHFHVKRFISYLWLNFCRAYAPNHWYVSFIYLYTSVYRKRRSYIYWSLRFLLSYIKHSILKNILIFKKE